MCSMLSDSTRLAGYDELGFVQSIPILTEDEVRHYRAELERTFAALGGGISRLDGPHLHFRWAWELSVHPRLLDVMEQLLGSPRILLKSTRVFYKHAGSASFVGWHQDGITERLEDARIPAVWLGLTAATVENGCLRVVPRSHRLGLIPHVKRPDPRNLTSGGITAEAEIGEPYDIEMQAGEMSLHHPLLLHASNPNHSDGPRIGFSATYSGSPMPGSRTAVRWVRGAEELAEGPADLPLEEAVAAYRAAGHQVLRTAM